MESCQCLEPCHRPTGRGTGRARRAPSGERRAERIRRKLLARREEFSSDLALRLAATAAGRDVFADAADLAATCVERQASGELDRVVSDAVAEIDRALGKLDDGTYGRCDDCGARIGAARLQAIPWATRCVACQEQRELETRESEDVPSHRGVLRSAPASQQEGRDGAFLSVRAKRLG